MLKKNLSDEKNQKLAPICDVSGQIFRSFHILHIENDLTANLSGEKIVDIYLFKMYLTLLASQRGALATDAKSCILWRSLLERPPPAPETRVRDPLGVMVQTRGGVNNHCLTCSDWANRPF